MATFYQLPSGKWRAQVHKHEFRDSASFNTIEEAEIWAANTEAQITASSEEVIELTPKEIFLLYRRSRNRAQEYGIQYLLSREQIARMFAATKGRCQVTGIFFNRLKPAGCSKRPWYPSLDRIDSNLPYTPENCRIVCVAANIAMGQWGEWVLLAMAKAIVSAEPAPTTPPTDRAAIVLLKKRKRKRPPYSRQEKSVNAESIA